MQYASDRRAEANGLAFERLAKSDPVLVDVRPAGKFVRGFEPNTILTSGPPMPWSNYTGGQREAIIGGGLFSNLAQEGAGAFANLAYGDRQPSGGPTFCGLGVRVWLVTASMT